MAEELQPQDNKKKKFIWLLLVLLLLIIAVIVYLLLSKYNVLTPLINLNENKNVNQIVNVPPAPAPSFNTPDSGILAQVQSKTQSVAQVEKTNAIFTASTFAERFGSYSNQSNYKNLDDLIIFMTEAMKKWVTETYKPSLIKQNSDSSTYYALETKAISNQVNILDAKAGKSEILIKTQRQEFKNNISNPRIFYQDILIKMIKVDNEWKVNGAYWQ